MLRRLRGSIQKSGRSLLEAVDWNAAQTVASATTCDIGAAISNSVIVSGTTAITGFGSTVGDGAMRWVQFSGILTLTHNATSLILPGGANITTAAGDCALFSCEGSGNWRCLNYTPASGLPVVAVSSIADAIVTYAKMASAAIASSSEYLLGTSSKLLNAANVWTARQAGGNTSTGTLAPDLSLGTNIDYTATGNFTLGVPTNAKVGMCGSIRFTQDGTGSRTITYNAIWKVAGGTAASLSTAASTVDVLFYEVVAASGGTPSLIYYSLAKGFA